MDTVDVRLLGAFSVTVDGVTLRPGAFPQRRAADLVKVLALADGHRLTRDAVVEALWPHLGAEAGIANLHKAAHHARRALGEPGAVVLRRGMVELAPAAAVTTDVTRFEAGDEDAYGGELLPDDCYEAWAVAARDRLRERRLELLRRRGRWSEVVAEEPADETAHRGLMRVHAARGDLSAVARQYAALRDALAQLGLRPDAETVALHQQLCSGPPVQARAVHAGPMLGRDDELKLAARALAAAADGRGGGVLVVGDAGLGKARFVDAVFAAAAQRGWHALRATAHDAEGGAPYRPLAGALEPLLVERPDLLVPLAPATRRVLGLLCPTAVRSERDARGGARGQDVLAAVARVLAVAARERGAVLAIEALQGADAATLAVLPYLVASARRERLLVVLSLRPDEGGDAVAGLRRRLLAQNGALEIRLRPLPVERVRPIVRRAAPVPLDDDAVDAIVRAAAGNPFFAEELAAAAERPDPQASRVALPPHIAAVLGARIDRLEAVAPRVLPLLAVLDDGGTTAEIAELAGTPADAVEPELLAGVRTGVLEATGSAWRFRHPLLREVARERVPAAELRAAHLRVADHLAATSTPPQRIALHLVAGGRERDAVPLLQQAAASAAELGAFADGERWVELALRHADAEQRPALLELLGDVRHGIGDPRAAGSYAAARQAMAAHDGAAGSRLRIKEARARFAVGDLAGAQRAIDGVGDHAGHGHAREHLVVQGMIAWYRGDFAAARRHADAAAADAADGTPDPTIDGAIFDLQAMVAHAEGRAEHAMETLLAEIWHVPQLAGRVVDVYLCVTEYVMNAGDPAQRLMGFARHLHEQAHAAGARRGVAFAATVLGEAHLMVGEGDRAARHLAEAVRLSRAVGTVGGEALARARLGEALELLGRRAEARAHLEEAVELAQASALVDHVLYLAYAPLLAAASDADDAMLLLDRAEAMLPPKPACRFCPVEYHVAAAVACARAGEAERGRAFLALAEQSAALWPGSQRASAVGEAHGELLLAEGRDAEAEIALIRAAEGFAVAGHRRHEDRVRARLAGRSQEGRRRTLLA